MNWYGRNQTSKRRKHYAMGLHTEDVLWAGSKRPHQFKDTDQKTRRTVAQPGSHHGHRPTMVGQRRGSVRLSLPEKVGCQHKALVDTCLTPCPSPPPSSSSPTLSPKSIPGLSHFSPSLYTVQYRTLLDPGEHSPVARPRRQAV